MILTKLAIVDDNETLRQVIIHYLNTTGTFNVLIEAKCGHDLLKKLLTKSPDIVIINIKIPVIDGIETVQLVKVHYPYIKIIVLTEFENETTIIELLKIGIDGFICKCRPEQIPEIINTVAHGGTHYCSHVKKTLQHHLVSNTQFLTKAPFFFSGVERTLLQALGEGCSSTKIAQLINKSPRTVEKYREDLYRKVGVKTKEQLIVLAKHWGLI